MSIEDNKGLVQRFIDEVLNNGNMASIDDLCVAGSMFAGGIAGQVKAMKMAIPDFNTVVNEIFAEGNKVAVRVATQGTNTGPLVGFPAFGRLEKPVPPSGKSVSGTGIYIFTISDGKILSYMTEFDQIGTLRQMGWTFVPPGQAREPAVKP